MGETFAVKVLKLLYEMKKDHDHLLLMQAQSIELLKDDLLNMGMWDFYWEEGYALFEYDIDRYKDIDYDEIEKLGFDEYDIDRTIKITYRF